MSSYAQYSVFQQLRCALKGIQELPNDKPYRAFLNTFIILHYAVFFMALSMATASLHWSTLLGNNTFMQTILWIVFHACTCAVSQSLQYLVKCCLDWRRSIVYLML